MFGFVAGGSPPPTRWGNGSDGDATWSGTVTKSGVFQFRTLTISDNALIKCGDSGVIKNGVVIFANQEIIIGNDVEFIAQPNSDVYRELTSWTSTGATGGYGFTGGGGGGGGGSNYGNCAGETGSSGSDPAIYHTTGHGTSYSDLLDALGTAADGGTGGANTSGLIGDEGYSPNSTIITDNFGFTLATVNGYDDFPVVKGGDGGSGGRSNTYYQSGDGEGESYCQYDSITVGIGGSGGGMIQLIAPKITFGTGVTLNAYGNRHGEGSDGVYTTSNSTGEQLQNLNGEGNGDQGSGGGGAGGGGLVAVVYWEKTGSYTADVASGYGGVGKTDDGNKGGNGGAGGNGVALDGQRPLQIGDITWS